MHLIDAGLGTDESRVVKIPRSPSRRSSGLGWLGGRLGVLDGERHAGIYLVLIAWIWHNSKAEQMTEKR